MQDAIDLKSVTRRFGDLVAVDDLSFAVKSGEIFGLLGPNGAGKTTAINLITGLLRRHGGHIQVFGFDPQIEARQVRRRIGLVPQETNVYGDLSAVDNLWHHAALYCADLTPVKRRIEALLRSRDVFDFRPAAIIQNLNLIAPIYRQVSAYGHFGRWDLELPWERLDKVDAIKQAL